MEGSWALIPWPAIFSPMALAELFGARTPVQSLQQVD